MSKPATLSASARTVLTAAAQRADRCALAPEHLPVATQRAVVQSLIKNGLIREVPADNDQAAWRTSQDGTLCALQVTDVGLRAVGVELATTTAEDVPTRASAGPPVAETAWKAPHGLPSPTNVQETALAAEPASKAVTNGPVAANTAALATAPANEAPHSLPLPITAQEAATLGKQASRRQALRSAAQAVLAAWGNPVEEGHPGLPGAMDASAPLWPRPVRRVPPLASLGRRVRTPSKLWSSPCYAVPRAPADRPWPRQLGGRLTPSGVFWPGSPNAA